MEDDYGKSYVALDSMEVIQFADFKMHIHNDEDAPRKRMIGTFLVPNVVAENCSSASLNAISSALSRPRRVVCVRHNTRAIERIGTKHLAAEDNRGNGIFTLTSSRRTIRLLPWFTFLASRKLDRALGRTELSFFAADGGFLKRNSGLDKSTMRKDLSETRSIQPKRVAFAIPNPQDPNRKADEPGWRPEAVTPKPLRGESDGEWTLEEQWAWLLSTGADEWIEAKPLQNRAEAEDLVAARVSKWTMATTSEGIGLVRNGQVSEEGSRYWLLASSRYIDLLILQMRAYGAFQSLSSELTKLSNHSAASTDDFRKLCLDEQHEAMRKDLKRLEDVQRDFLDVRNRFWLETIPSRQIDTKIMRALRDDLGTTELFHSFNAELEAREKIIHTQYDQLRIERNKQETDARREEDLRRIEREQQEEEARRKKDDAEAARQDDINFAIAIIAAGFAGPDWAGAIFSTVEWWNALLMAVLAGLGTWGLLRRISTMADKKQ